MSLLTPTEFRNMLGYVVRSSELHALDLETTGLDPALGAEARLAQVCGPATHHQPYVVDFRQVPGGLAAWSEWEEGRWAAFNFGFENKFLQSAGHSPELHDVGLMKASVVGGSRASLARMAYDDLGVELNKDEQASDWSAPVLTEDQIHYAAEDARITDRLVQHWHPQISVCGVEQGYLRLIRVLDAVADCEATGLRLDRRYHANLTLEWQRRAYESDQKLRALLGLGPAFNINSQTQITELMMAGIQDQELLGMWPKTPTKKLKLDDRTLKAMAHATTGSVLSDWLAELDAYHKQFKYLGLFGPSLSGRCDAEDVVHSQYHIAAAITTRFSCSKPNAQQFLKEPEFRRCFIARPGRVLVVADYSQIELVVAAELGDDQNLRDALASGDVHRATAAFMFRCNEEDVIPAQRRAAKSINFGIVYGAGAASVSVNAGLPYEEAAAFIQRWLAAYPGIDRYRQRSTQHMLDTWELRLQNGCRVVPPKFDPETGKPTGMPFASNCPIQGSAAEVQREGMIQVMERLHRTGLYQAGVRMAASVHDEILLDSPEGEVAQEAARVLAEGMQAGFELVFPDAPKRRVVDAKICSTWAEKS